MKGVFVLDRIERTRRGSFLVLAVYLYPGACPTISYQSRNGRLLLRVR